MPVHYNDADGFAGDGTDRLGSMRRGIERRLIQ